MIMTFAAKYVPIFPLPALRMLPRVLKIAMITKPSARPNMSMIFEIGRYMIADAILEMIVKTGNKECALNAEVAYAANCAVVLPSSDLLK